MSRRSVIARRAAETVVVRLVSSTPATGPRRSARVGDTTRPTPIPLTRCRTVPRTTDAAATSRSRRPTSAGMHDSIPGGFCGVVGRRRLWTGCYVRRGGAYLAHAIHLEGRSLLGLVNVPGKVYAAAGDHDLHARPGEVGKASGR